MVYIPWLNFKTGINPSVLSRFPVNGQYTGTQKLLLTKMRIFGNKYSGNYPSGWRVFKKVKFGRFEQATEYNCELYNMQRVFPLFRQHLQDEVYRARKERRAQAKLKKQAKKKKK